MTAQKLGPNRRMGPVGSENWHAMLDGAEHILREEGHAKLTSRRIADQVGVKQRLVYYYFHTMDDLIVAMFQRSSDRDLRQLREIAGSPMPLRRLWAMAAHSHDARLISEYMALANRIPALKAEVIRFIDESRAIQVAAITQAQAACDAAPQLPASALAIIATSVGLSLNREEQLGLSSGHADMQAVLAGLLDLLEPQG